MASSALININGGITTYDAVPSTIVMLPVDLQVMRVQVSTLAVRPSNNNVKTWSQLFLVERHNGGPSMTGSLLDLVAPIGTAITTTTWTVGVSITGNNVVIQVTGQASALINWYCSADCLGVMGD